MQTYQPGDIRNFALVGHASSGKTLLSEAMLACSGAIGRMGRIADGSTVFNPPGLPLALRDWSLSVDQLGEGA